MKTYDKYKSSGVDWIDNIPEHWHILKTKHVFKYTTGFTPPTGENRFYDGDITWITIGDMNEEVVSDSSTKLTDIAIDICKPDLTVKNSLLFSFKLSVGKVAFAGTDLLYKRSNYLNSSKQGLWFTFFLLRSWTTIIAKRKRKHIWRKDIKSRFNQERFYIASFTSWTNRDCRLFRRKDGADRFAYQQ